MDLEQAVRAFGALAHAVRLQAFRALAREGRSGLCAGALAERLAQAPSSLSFHLRALVDAELLACTRRGRELRYSVRPEALHELLWYFGEDACQGRLALCPAPTARIGVARATDPGRSSVLFVCTQNAARSQIAEVLLRQRAGDRFEVASAGIRPAAVHPLTRRVLREVDATARLRSKDLGELLGKTSFEHVIVLCAEAASECDGIAGLSRRRLDWPLPDPAAVRGPVGKRLEAFRNTREEIGRRLEEWLRQPARERHLVPSSRSEVVS